MQGPQFYAMHAVLFLAIGMGPTLADPAFGQGLIPLTNETHNQALALAPKAAEGCASNIVALRNIATMDLITAARHYKELVGRDLAFPQDFDEQRRLAILQGQLQRLRDDFPYSTMILSPYCRLAISADAAARSFMPLNTSFDASTVQTVVVAVSTGASFVAAEDIKHMVIKRDDVVIQPIKVDLHTNKVQNRAGASREIVVGDFTFPVEALSVGAKITLVWVGPGRNWEFTFTPDELAKLK